MSTLDSADERKTVQAQLGYKNIKSDDFCRRQRKSLMEALHIKKDESGSRAVYVEPTTEFTDYQPEIRSRAPSSKLTK